MRLEAKGEEVEIKASREEFEDAIVDYLLDHEDNFIGKRGGLHREYVGHSDRDWKLFISLPEDPSVPRSKWKFKKVLVAAVVFVRSGVLDVSVGDWNLLSYIADVFGVSDKSLRRNITNDKNRRRRILLLHEQGLKTGQIVKELGVSRSVVIREKHILCILPLKG